MRKTQSQRGTVVYLLFFSSDSNVVKTESLGEVYINFSAIKVIM